MLWHSNIHDSLFSSLLAIPYSSQCNIFKHDLLVSFNLLVPSDVLCTYKHCEFIFCTWMPKSHNGVLNYLVGTYLILLYYVSHIILTPLNFLLNFMALLNTFYIRTLSDDTICIQNSILMSLAWHMEITIFSISG